MRLSGNYKTELKNLPFLRIRKLLACPKRQKWIAHPAIISSSADNDQRSKYTKADLAPYTIGSAESAVYYVR
jgi:hypothetical protein